MNEPQSFAEIVLSPPVLVTFILCAMLAALAIWLALGWQRRRLTKTLAHQRSQQEATVERLLEAVSHDKEQLIAQYEAALREHEARLALIEGENSRLRDRLSSAGLLGMFGGKQRDVIGALLLENEQLHELLAQKQTQLRDLVSDLTGKLMDRLDEQARESAQAVRYKQALLSAFLEREEARRLLDQLLQEGKIAASPPALSEGEAKET